MRAGSLIFPVLVVVSTFILSCQIVKEDRELCPCSLTIDVCGAHGDVRLLLEGTSFQMDTVINGDSSFTLRVPRPDVRLTAVSGAEWDGGVMIEEGQECPPLFLGVCRIGTDSEKAVCVSPLHKAYCQVDMQFKCPPGWKPLPVVVSGNVCGYGRDGNPLEGAFRCGAEPGAAGRCTFRIPRQRDASLLLTFGSSWTFSLGEYLLQSGYDWGEADLRDVALDIDISLTDISFRIDSWSFTEKLWFLI